MTVTPLLCRKPASRIRTSPAGIDTTDRIVGIIRPNATTTDPNRPNSRSTRSTSYQSIVSHRPCRSMNGQKRRKPIQRAMRYQKRFPVIAPAVPLATIAPASST